MHNSAWYEGWSIVWSTAWSTPRRLPLSTAVALAGSTFALASCTTPELNHPTAISSEVSAGSGVAPNWQTSLDSGLLDGESLRSASADPLPNPLDERRAVEIALGASPEIARMLAETEGLRCEAMDVSAPMNPVISLTSGVPLDSMSVVPIFAMLMVQIDELWKQPIRSESAHASYEAALLSLGAGAIAITSDARSLWHEVALRDEECLLAAHDSELAERLLAIARERFAVGEGDASEVAQAQSDFAQAHHRVETANEMRSAARLALMALLGRPEAPIEWTVGAADASSAFAVHGPLSDEPAMLDRLAQSRLDVRAAQARVAAAKAKVTLAQRGRIGRFEVGAGWERDMESDQAVGVAANIELPIFNRGDFRIGKAIADLRAAEIAAERTRQVAIIELRGAIVKAKAAQSRHEITETSTVTPWVASARRTAEALAAGEAAPRESFVAERALAQAKLELTDLERQRRTARLALSKSAGFLPAEEMP